MQQQVSVITLGVSNLEVSKRFYVDGFGWRPTFDNGEIAFFQMNGIVLGLWLKRELDKDMNRRTLPGPGSVAIGHNVASPEEVTRLMERLLAFGGRKLRSADAPPHGGYRGYVADPDDHAWEIAWNPAWTMDDLGHVTFRV